METGKKNDYDKAIIVSNDGDFYFLRDLISGQGYTWRGSENFVILDPNKNPGHLFVLRKV